LLDFDPERAPVGTLMTSSKLVECNRLWNVQRSYGGAKSKPARNSCHAALAVSAGSTAREPIASRFHRRCAAGTGRGGIMAKV